MSFLRLAVEEHEAELVWIGVEPRFDPIRGTSEFQGLMVEFYPRSPLRLSGLAAPPVDSGAVIVFEQTLSISDR